MPKELKAEYPSESLKCWPKVKELREKFYRDYASAHERGGIRWSGGAGGIEAIPAGLGRDVYPLTGEPYGASIAFDRKFAAKCHDAADEAGYPRDLCAYMRNYWGSELLNEYLFGGPFPQPDFFWQFHICCSHGKWYQEAARIGGNKKPVLLTDATIGPYFKENEETGEFYAAPSESGLRYIADQLHDHIGTLEKITGRTFQDELLFEASENFFENMTFWPKICVLNQSIPAPLDEKSMFALYVLGTLNKSSVEHLVFYRELLDEVQDRVDRGIAALATENARIVSDIQPPWGFLKMFRYLEEYGCISIGSMYSLGITYSWSIGEDGTLTPRLSPKERGIEIKDRDQCLLLLADYLVSYFWIQNMQEHRLKSYIMQKIYEQWHCDGVMMHYNRGCEGLSLGIAENRLHLVKQGIPVVSYEGNMGDEREFDLVETQGMIDSFMESIGLK